MGGGGGGAGHVPHTSQCLYQYTNMLQLCFSSSMIVQKNIFHELRNVYETTNVYCET